MKIKTQLTLASVIAAGLLASGCSQQMVAQQSAPVEAAAPATVVKTVVDCSSCNKPAPRPRPSGNMHGHPAVPGCTDSVKHNHPHPKGGNHSHKYSCKKPMMKPAPMPAPRPRPAPKPRPVMNPDAHTHPAVPNCTNSIRHVHANGRNAHNHRYACQKPAMRPVVRPAPRPRPIVRPMVPVQQPVPVMPKVKAKGTYRGPIKIDGVMQQYQQ